MKQHGNRKKRFATLCLAAVLFLSLVLPGVSYAQEPLETDILEESTSETQAQTDAETFAESMPEMQTAENFTEAETGMDDSQIPADSDTLEESTDEIQVQTDAQGQTEETGKVAETDGTEENDKAEETDQISVDLNTQPVSENYDTEKPVIENVQLVQNGQTLKEGETVELRVKAYDAKSGISSVTADFYGKDGGFAHTMSLAYDDASGEYVGTWTLENMASVQIQLRELQVTDNSHNYIQAEVRDENWNYKYWFNAISETVIKIADFQFAANGQTLKEDQIGSDLGFSLTLDQPINPYENVYICFKSSDGYYYTFGMSADNTGMNLNYSYRTAMEPYGDVSKTYTLDRIYLSRTGGNVELDIAEIGTYSFTVDHTKGEDSTEDTDPEDEVKITGIEISHNGETVNVGDTVQLKIYVESQEKLNSSGKAIFYAASDITDDTRYIELLYNEEKGMYTGTFEIREELYPCEWYLNSLELWTTSKHSFYFSSENYPYYINVFNEDTFTEATRTAYVSFVTKDVSGVYQYSESIAVENAGRRPTLGDLGITLPEMSSAITGVNQTGWEDENGNPVTMDTKLYNDGSIYIYATYDKLAVPVYYSYAVNNGAWGGSVRLYILEPGSTYGMLIEKASEFQPDDAMAGHPIVEWKGFSMGGYSEDEVIDPRIDEFSMSAQYDDVLLLLKKGYFNANGGYTQGDFYLDGAYQGSLAFFVPKGTTYKELKDILNAQELPEMYEGLRFTGWTYPGITEDMDNQEVTETSVEMKAEYENFIIRYVIWNETGETNRVFCQTAEAGETVTIPDTFDGIDGKVSWFDPIEGSTFVVDGEYREEYGKCYTFAGSGKLSDTSAQPEEPGETEEPETPDQPQTPETGLPSEMVDTIIENIQNTADGQTVTVPMNGATVISKDILQAAKGRDVTIVLDMGGYTWTINGMNILASDLKDINLEVKFDTNAVPSSIVKELAGNQPVRQISLTHNGDFGFKATLTMNAGAEYAGQYGNLYYYDSDGKLVFMNAGAIGADGNVSLDFSHASDYVLVISEQVMNPGNGSGGQETSGGNGQNLNTQSQETPKTGDTTPLAMIIVIMAVCAGIGVIAVKKRFFTKES
ncbi:MAG: hypothetical protein KHX56_00890 [Clostridiales bacterium]|nr:hypothetical protein [Clostridiales bacterium]